MRVRALLVMGAMALGATAWATDEAPRDWQGALDLRKAVTIKSQQVAVNSDELRAAGVDERAFTPPKRIGGKSPAYPEVAARDGAQGTVLIDCLITELGAVGPCRVNHSVHPAIDRAAVRAIERWKYEPARVREEPRRIIVQFMMIFRLQ